MTTPITFLCAFMLALAPARVSFALARDDDSPTDAEVEAEAETVKAATPKPADQPPLFSPSDLEELRAEYEQATPRERGQIRAIYKDREIDIEQVLGVSERRKRDDALLGGIIAALKDLEFARTPAAVLTERARLAKLRVVPNPAAADPASIALWLHSHAVAGEWAALRDFLRFLPPGVAAETASTILTHLSAADAQLLPEEVLELASIAPAELKTVDITSLARMLAPSARTHGTATLMDRLREGTPQFGLADADPPRQLRTVLLLESADLVDQAYLALPSLERARADSNVTLLMAHAKALDARSRRLAEGSERNSLRRSAFELFAEASVMEQASPEQTREAIQRAVALMPELPQSLSDAWLSKLFHRQRLTRVAAEVLALESAKLADDSLRPEDAAKKVVSISKAVDAMLDVKGRDPAELAVPLRVLAGAFSARMESVLEVRRTDAYGWRWGRSSMHLPALQSASPSVKWLDAIEPSVAARAAKASITIAILNDNPEAAIERLRDAAKRAPADAPKIAEHLLQVWADHLRLNRSQYQSDGVPSRGEQTRQLRRIRDLLNIMRDLGVDPAQLANTLDLFAACHQQNEIYRKEDIESALGPIAALPERTAAQLADTMRQTVQLFWRMQLKSPPASQSAPLPTLAELSRVINQGYDTAMELIASARASAPGLWSVEAIHASIAYDRLKLNQRLGNLDPGSELEVLATSFAAFEQAAQAYAAALRDNQQVETTDIYDRWFRAALGASDVHLLSLDELADEGSPGDAQFAKIRSAIQLLPEDAAFRHTAAFAALIVGTLENAPFHAKPRLARAALQVVANHPAGDPLRRANELYTDFAQRDMKLRLTVHGEPAVTAAQPFGVMLSVRFTNAVAGATDGFEQYLTTNSGGHQRDILEREVRRAFSKGFQIRGISWFPAQRAAEAVVEDGQDAWLEKPLAMIYISTDDASIDRLPQVKMQVDLESEEVSVVLASNAPAITVSSDLTPRPCQELAVTQTVDARESDDPERPLVILEVSARGRGAIPDLPQLLQQYDAAVPGFTLVQADVVAKPWMFPLDPPVSAATAKPLAPARSPQLGVEVPLVEREWMLRYKPAENASASTAVTFPVLASSLDGTVTNRAFGAVDIVPITSATFPISARASWPRWTIATGILAVGAIVAAAWYIRRRAGALAPAPAIPMPKRRSPLAALVILKRWQRDHAQALDASAHDALAADIQALEAIAFGPESLAASSSDAHNHSPHHQPLATEAISRWESRLSSRIRR
jgi:hypothetical protein